MYKFKIPIGDWFDKKCKVFTVESNYTIDQVQQAYKDSCKLTGLSFNERPDYTGLSLSYTSDRILITKFGSNSISKLAEGILLTHGIDVWDGIEYGRLDKSIDKVYVNDPKHFIELLILFIKLTLKDLNCRIVKDNLPYFTGYSKGLNAKFGTGL